LAANVFFCLLTASLFVCLAAIVPLNAITVLALFALKRFPTNSTGRCEEYFLFIRPTLCEIEDCENLNPDVSGILCAKIDNDTDVFWFYFKDSFILFI